MTDFSNIAPCGGDCTGCDYYKKGECAGCLNNGGKCVSMWENGCAVYDCCKKHEVLFCGICSEFPCEWLENKISEWDKNGIAKLHLLAEEFGKGK